MTVGRPCPYISGTTAAKCERQSALDHPREPENPFVAASISQMPGVAQDEPRAVATENRAFSARSERPRAAAVPRQGRGDVLFH